MRHYAMSDIHGMKNLFNQAMDYITSNSEDYTLYFLGDAADRGEDGYEIMKSLLSNPHVIYLKGNHEDIFVNAAKEFRGAMLHKFNGSFSDMMMSRGGHIDRIMKGGSEMRLHLQNGGLPTMEAWIADGMPMDIINQLDALPYKASYKQFDMCHAGTYVNSFNENDGYSMIWCRSHFARPWMTDRTLIFGHTPVPYLLDELDEHMTMDVDGPFAYEPLLQNVWGDPIESTVYGGRKIDIDCGAFFTGITALYDLDNDKPIVFHE